MRGYLLRNLKLDAEAYIEFPSGHVECSMKIAETAEIMHAAE